MVAGVFLTANRLALAILLSMRWLMAMRRSCSRARSCAWSSRIGEPSSYTWDHNDTVYMAGGWADDINGEMFQMSAPCTRSNSSALIWSPLFKMIRVWYSRPFNWSKMASVSGPASNFAGSYTNRMMSARSMNHWHASLNGNSFDTCLRTSKIPGISTMFT